MEIPLWTHNNPQVKEILLPTNPTKWADLTSEEKERMWRHLESFLFDPRPSTRNANFNEVSCSYVFYGADLWENDHLARTVSLSIRVLNNRYKRHSYARNFLEDGTFNSACHDFYNIFLTQSRDVVFELITLFANATIMRDGERLWKKQDENDEDFEARKEIEKWKRFDKFSRLLGEVFEEFGVNYKLTRAGLIPADEPTVIEDIYKPALKKLSNEKWFPVNRDLRDTFQALNNDKDGSGALTHALSALQGFLQIIVHGKTGKGDTSALINEAVKKKLIPDDDFSKKIIKDMNSFWARERQDKGDPHPKKSYATKAQAKLVISLIMVFVDHSL